MTFTDCGREVHKKPPFKMTDILCILFIINEQESRYSELLLKGEWVEDRCPFDPFLFVLERAALPGLLDRSSFMDADYRLYKVYRCVLDT